MRKSMMEIVVCPMDKSPLELTIEQEDGDQVIQGYMTCTKCSEKYPIEDRIPNFLPPEMRKAAT
jgi:uncharacterized protein YbaR (Trm112 family)